MNPYDEQAIESARGEEIRTKKLKEEIRYLAETVDSLTTKVKRAEFLFQLIEELLTDQRGLTHYQRTTIHSLIINKIRVFNSYDDFFGGF